MLWYVPSLPALVRVFIMNGHWILSDAFPASIEMIMCFLSFLLWTWCITLIDICMLNHLCDPGMNPTWLWCMILFLCVVGFGLLIFCWEFLHLYSSKILAFNFLLWYCFWFWYQGDGGFLECLWECSLFNLLVEEFGEGFYKFFFVCLVEFPSEAIWSWLRFAGSFFITYCISLLVNGLFKFSFFIQFWWVVCF